MLKFASDKIIKSLNNKFAFALSTFIVNNPTTGKPCVEFPNTDGNAQMKKQQIIMNTGRAKWQILSVADRKVKLQLFYEQFQLKKEELIQIIQLSTGKHRESAQFQIQMSLAALRQDLNDKFPQTTKKDDGIYDFRPFGNILIVCDYRMVSVSCVKYLVSCAIAGNSLILNPHRYGLPVAKMIQNIWRATFPEYPLIYCPINNYADGLQYLVQKKDMGFVSFTGDIQAGNSFYHFMAQKSEILAESEFLLTSSDSAYVMGDLTDSQLIKTAENLAFASFSSAGNLFNSVKRIFVDQLIDKKFTELFVKASEKYKIKYEQSKASPIITADHINLAKKYIKQLQQYKGDQMKLLTQFDLRQSYKSLYLSPIVYKVDGISSIEYWNKIYPMPICFIESVSSSQSAIQQINSSIFGNTSTIYTSNISKIHQIGQQLDVGVVYGNNWGYSPGVPFSPRKRSGKGSSFSVHSFSNVVKSQSLKGYYQQK